MFWLVDVLIMFRPEMTPADMVLDSESSDNAKIVDVEVSWTM